MKWFMNFFRTDTIKSVSNDIKDVKIYKYNYKALLSILLIVAIVILAFVLGSENKIISDFLEILKSLN